MTELKLSTKIYHQNKKILKELPDMLYQPKDAIQIEGVIYNKWSQYDEFEHGNYVVRHIFLQKNTHNIKIEMALKEFPKSAPNIRKQRSTALNY